MLGFEGVVDVVVVDVTGGCAENDVVIGKVVHECDLLI